MTEINVTMEIFSAILLFILMIQVSVRKRRVRQRRAFSAVLFFHFIACVADALAWIFDDIPGTTAFVVAYAGNFLTYLMMPMTYLAFLYYLYVNVDVDIKEKLKPFDRFLTVLICSFSIVFILITLTNPWTGLLYYVSEANHFYWGPCCNLYYWFGGAQSVLAFLLMLLQRKCFRGTQIVWYTLFLLCPLTGFLSAILGHELMIIYPAIAFSLQLINIYIYQEQERSLLRKEKDLSERRLAMMIGQIQPHFLYNALVAIMNLCEKEPARVKEAIAQFGKYLRGNLDSQRYTEPVAFSVEKKLIESYVYIERLRFGDRLSVVYDFGVTAFYLPAMSIQPLIENAIKYSFADDRAHLTITLLTYESGDSICVEIVDDGVGFDVDAPMTTERSHTGIENVRTRLELMMGGTLEIESVRGKGTTARISIPKDWYERKGMPE